MELPEPGLRLQARWAAALRRWQRLRYRLVPDCPFSAGGATGAGSGDCVGSSPSYYETLQAADVDGVRGDELLARASDGLRVKKWVPGSSGGSWNLLTTLTALAGAASSVPDGMWGSIRTGDVDGIGKQEVLFLVPDGKGLQAWSYDPGPKRGTSCVPRRRCGWPATRGFRSPSTTRRSRPVTSTATAATT